MTHLTRNVAGGAYKTTLAGAITAGSPAAGGTFSITDATGWPTGTFAVVIDRGLATQETIICSARSGTTLTVAASGRGADGSTAANHANLATVEHDLDLTAITALLEHVNTDAGHDHAAYKLHSAIGASTPTALTYGGAGSAGSSASMSDIGHIHAVAAGPAFKVENSVNQSIPHNTLTTVTFDTTDLNTGGGTYNGVNTYTVPAAGAGVWVAELELPWDAVATGYREADFLVSGTVKAVAKCNTITTGGVGTVQHAFALLVGVANAATLTVQVRHTNGGAAAMNMLAGARWGARWVRP